MADTVLGNVLEFFRDLGVYDVLLPFILVFTIMFAILERTKIFGVEGEKKHTKKNLNAMTSFVIAFMVVASAKLVEAITKMSSEIILVLIVIVFLLMLVGAFRSHEDIGKGELIKEKGLLYGLITFAVISISVIFLDAMVAADGRTWLEVFWDWLSQFYTNAAVAAVILIIFVIVLMWFVMGGKEK